jgi:hypothetical protein
MGGRGSRAPCSHGALAAVCWLPPPRIRSFRRGQGGLLDQELVEGFRAKEDYELDPEEVAAIVAQLKILGVKRMQVRPRGCGSRQRLRHPYTPPPHRHRRRCLLCTACSRDADAAGWVVGWWRVALIRGCTALTHREGGQS